MRWTHRFKNVQALPALKFVWTSTPYHTAVNGFLTFIQGLIPLGTLYLIKLVIDFITASVNSGKIPQNNTLIPLIFYLAGLALLHSCVRFLRELITEHQTQIIVDKVNHQLHEKSSQMDLEYYENSQFYDSLHRAQNEAHFRPLSITNNLMGTFQNAISFISVSVLLFTFHWAISLIIFISVIPSMIVRYKYSNVIFNWNQKKTPEERQSWYYNWVLTGKEFAKELRLFNSSSLFISRFKNIRKKLRTEKLKISIRKSLTEFLGQFVIVLSFCICFAWMGYQALLGLITLGSLVMYFQAFQRSQTFLDGMFKNLSNIYEDGLFLSNFYKFLNLKPKVTAHEPVTKPPEKIIDGIEFNEVNFSYPGSDRKILEKINFSIKPGEHVALVGENGAGKSTLVKLLLRFYDPKSGSILVDNQNLKNIQPQVWRNGISGVFQDYVKYYLSASDNIRMGNIETQLNLEKVKKVAQITGVNKFIEKLPQGYDTILGNWLEEGEELSVGEWQKIALARAFMRDAPLIVLDEPSSAMDAKSEFDLFQNFHLLAKGKTAVIISHRFSTVRSCHRIFILKDGHIVESGSHQELVAQNGLYAEMYEIQASSYR